MFYLILSLQFPNITKSMFEDSVRHSIVNHIEIKGASVFAWPRPLLLDNYKIVKVEFQKVVGRVHSTSSKTEKLDRVEITDG